MTQAQKLYTFSSTRAFLRGCVFALFVAALLTALPCPVQAEMLLFWNFDEDSSATYVTDVVHSERLNLVNASIVDGKLTANGGYAQGTGTNNGVSVTLPTGTASYTLSAFLTTNRNGAVGIISWGVSGATRQTNSFRTDTSGLKNYWWNDDLSVTGYPEVYAGVENHVVATGSGRTQTLYLNGQLIGTRNANGDRNEQNRAFFVGNTINNNTETLYGSIDNASIYNDVMAHTDIINISSSRYNGLTNLWKSGQNIDIVSGAVKPGTVTGTTVITGTSGDIMVFNRALTAGEQAYYQGQLASEHAYVNSMADSDPAKTTWINTSTADLSDAAQTPLGIYVGGMNSAATLTATAQQLNAVNHTLVLGNGMLNLSSDSPVTFETNKVNFDGGSVTIAASNDFTFNSDHMVNVRAVTMGASSNLTFNAGEQVAVRTVSSAANSVLEFNATDKIQVLNALSGSGTVVFSDPATTTLFSQSTAFTGTLVVKDGNELVFTAQDTFNNAHNNGSAKVVIDGGTVTNTGTIYEYLTTVTMKNGAQIYAANGNATWEAFKIFNLNVVRNDDGSAAAPVRIAANMSNPDATVSFGPQSNQVAGTTTTIKVEDITSASGSSDNISDLVISSVITDPTTVNTGFKTAGAINKTGSGTLELAATNVYRGKTTISEGTLALTAPNAVYNVQAIVNNSAITTTEDQTFRNLSGNGTVTANDKNLTLITDRSTTFTGKISGVDTLSAEGHGPLNVTGATISTANLEARQDSVVNVPAANAITVTESFRQSNSAQFTFTDASASVSGSNIATQAAITLNGGTMSFNTFAYQTAPTLTVTDGLALHLDASVASSFDNSSAIKSWTNLADSSNNLYLANISGSNTAHVTQNAKNGLNVVTFPADGTANYNLTTAINGVTYFAVMADNGNTSDSAYSFLFGNSGGSNYFYHRGTGSTLYHPQYTNANVKNGSTILNGISVPYDAADIGYDWNVMSLQTTSAVSLTAISRDRNIANRGWHGDVAEILVYTTALTDAQIKAVSQYLATKWQVGTDIIEPSVVTTGEFASNNTFTVAESSTIDLGAFTKVTFGTTTINQNKSLSVNVAENQTTELKAVITGAGDFIKTGEGTMILSNQNSNFTGDLYINDGKIKVSVQRTNSNSAFGKVQAGRSVYVNSGAELVFCNQDIFDDAHHNEPVTIVANGGKVSNEGAYYNFLQNLTLQDGGELYASDGHSAWEAYKLHNVNVLRNSDGTAADPVSITSSEKAHAAICFGDITDKINASTSESIIYVEDITSESADTVDEVSDLVISAKIVDPTISRSGTVGNKKSSKIVKTGAGTLELTADNPITGQTTISDGTIKLTDSGTLGTSPITLETNAAANTSGTLQFAVENEKWFTSNSISGNGTIRKTGDGVLYLNGTSDNPIASTALFVEEGSLMFKGNYAGDLTVNAGTLLSPGNSVGDLIVDGAVTIDGGATLLLEQDASGMDSLTASTFSVSPDAILDLAPSALTPGATYTLLTQDEDFSDEYNVDFWTSLLSPEDAYIWNLSVVNNMLMATVDASAVPEPSTWALLILGAAGLMYWRKRNS